MSTWFYVGIFLILLIIVAVYIIIYLFVTRSKTNISDTSPSEPMNINILSQLSPASLYNKTQQNKLRNPKYLNTEKFSNNNE